MEEGEGEDEKMKPGLVQLDPKEKMTYTEQAAKRQHCQRLTRCCMHEMLTFHVQFHIIILFIPYKSSFRTVCYASEVYLTLMYAYTTFPCSFIRLCDYLVVTMLHGLTLQSCTQLLSLLQSQLEKAVEVTDIVKAIPEDVDEQEKILQVSLRRVNTSCDH